MAKGFKENFIWKPWSMINSSAIIKGYRELTKVFSRNIKVFYWRGAKDSNFGDQLNLNLLEFYGYKPVHTTPGHAEIFAIGSILGYYLERYDCMILGSGYIQPPDKPVIKPERVLALRGPLTNSFIKKKNAVMCDPGILARRIFGDFEKKHDLGIVPHFRDKNDAALEKFLERNRSIKFIDVEKAPKDVVKDIAGCETILSSSLHGLVIADSYNIPAVWINFADRQTGGEFKFTDYHLSLGIERTRVRIFEDTTSKHLCSFSVRADNRAVMKKDAQVADVFNRLWTDLIFLRIKRLLKRVLKTLQQR